MPCAASAGFEAACARAGDLRGRDDAARVLQALRGGHVALLNSDERLAQQVLPCMNEKISQLFVHTQSALVRLCDCDWVAVFGT